MAKDGWKCRLIGVVTKGIATHWGRSLGGHFEPKWHNLAFATDREGFLAVGDAWVAYGDVAWLLDWLISTSATATMSMHMSLNRSIVGACIAALMFDRVQASCRGCTMSCGSSTLLDGILLSNASASAGTLYRPLRARACVTASGL